MASSPATYVVIVPAPNSVGFYPNPLPLEPGGLVRWHCNPGVPTNQETQTYTIRFSDESLFGVSSVTANIGETTEALTVAADTKAGHYSYSIGVMGLTQDPEIIIEEGVPEPRAMGAHA